MPGRSGDSPYRSALDRKRKSTMDRRLSYTWIKPATVNDDFKGDRRESQPSSSPPPEVVFDSRTDPISLSPVKYPNPPPQIIFTIPKDYSMLFTPKGKIGFEKVVVPLPTPPTLPSPKGSSSAPVSPVAEFQKVKHRLFRRKFTPSPIAKERLKQQDKQDLEYFVKHFLGDGYSITGPGKL